jgi:hypothetical protein
VAYDWFSGWRWECYRDGVLSAESLLNFESSEDCLADIDRHRGGAGTEGAWRCAPQRGHRPRGFA